MLNVYVTRLYVQQRFDCFIFHCVYPHCCAEQGRNGRLDDGRVVWTDDAVLCASVDVPCTAVLNCSLLLASNTLCIAYHICWRECVQTQSCCVLFPLVIDTSAQRAHIDIHSDNEHTIFTYVYAIRVVDTTSCMAYRQTVCVRHTRYQPECTVHKWLYWTKI